jgi:hypothetical protein
MYVHYSTQLRWRGGVSEIHTLARMGVDAHVGLGTGGRLLYRNFGLAIPGHNKGQIDALSLFVLFVLEGGGMSMSPLIHHLLTS